MAIVVKENIMIGHTLQETRGVLTAPRVFDVTGLDAAPELQLMQAMQRPEIPAYGDPYPLPDPPLTYAPYSQMFAITRTAEPNGLNAARVRVTYSTDQGSSFNQEDPPQGERETQDVKQVTATLEEGIRYRDHNNDPMVLTPPASWNLPEYNYEFGATILVPVGGLIFERKENQPPNDRARLLGSVNDAAIGPYGARELLFARLDAYSDDGGRQWRVTYEFRYAPDNWDVATQWRTPVDNKPAEGGTLQLFRVYPEIDYSQFGLDFADAQTPI